MQNINKGVQYDVAYGIKIILGKTPMYSSVEIFMYMIENIFTYSKLSLPIKGVLTKQQMTGKSLVSEKGPNELVVSEKGHEKQR